MVKKTFYCIALCVLVSVFCGQGLKAQNIAVSTNLVEWGFFSPNVEFALVTGDKSSVHLGAVYTNHPYHLDFGGFIITPEYRYWLKGRPFSRMFFGAAAGFASYDRAGYEGLSVMLGPTIGYDIILSDKWSIDICAGAGGAHYRQRQVGQKTDTDPAALETSGFTWAPVKAGISIVYIIK